MGTPCQPPRTAANACPCPRQGCSPPSHPAAGASLGSDPPQPPAAPLAAHFAASQGFFPYFGGQFGPTSYTGGSPNSGSGCTHKSGGTRRWGQGCAQPWGGLGTAPPRWALPWGDGDAPAPLLLPPLHPAALHGTGFPASRAGGAPASSPPRASGLRTGPSSQKPAYPWSSLLSWATPPGDGGTFGWGWGHGAKHTIGHGQASPGAGPRAAVTPWTSASGQQHVLARLGWTAPPALHPSHCFLAPSGCF